MLWRRGSVRPRGLVPMGETPGPAGDGPKSDAGPIPMEPADASGAPAPSGKGRLNEPGLLEDFDEDADFDRDPELEKAVIGDRPPLAAPVGPIDDRPLFVKAGW